MEQTRLSGFLQWLFQPGAGLSNRVLHAGTWTLIGRGFLRTAGIARTIVLARLLTPEDFGVMAIALMAWFFLELLTNAGFSAALVQRKGDIRSYLDTAWSLNIARGLLLGVALLAVAPLAASFFHTPGAAPVVQVMAAVAFLQVFTNPGIIYLQRDLEFHKRFYYEASRTVVEVAVAIALAVALRNVWALVFGLLAGEAAGVLASYLVHSMRPRLKVEWGKARELLRFGRWVYLGAVLDAFAAQIDKGVVARLMGAAPLGLYQMAARLSYVPFRESSYMVYGVVFPAYARMQDDPDRLRAAYLRTLGLVASLVVPLALAVFFLADALVPLVIGEQWLSAVPAIQVLAFAGCARALTAPLRALLYGTGRPGLGFWVNGSRDLLLIALVYPLTSGFGVTGAALAVLLASLGTLPVQIGYAATLLRVNWKHCLETLFPSLATSGAVGLVLLLSTSGNGQLSLANLVIVAGLASSAYIGSNLILWASFKAGPLQALVNLRGP